MRDFEASKFHQSSSYSKFYKTDSLSLELVSETPKCHLVFHPSMGSMTLVDVRLIVSLHTELWSIDDIQ